MTGPCGVVDYTEQLADGLCRLGLRVAIVGVRGPLNPGAQRWSDEAFPSGKDLVRWELGTTDVSEGFNRLGLLLNRVQPALVSLQFFPYGFSTKGLFIRNLGPLRRALRGHRVHLMFHEIWTDTSFRTDLRTRAIEGVRCLEIALLGRLFRNRSAHTTCEQYQASLARVGIGASLLPVCSNIRFHRPPPALALESFMPGEGWPEDLRIKDHFFVAALFGRIYPTWGFEPLLLKLRQASEAESRRLCVVSIGAAGFGNDGWKRVVEFCSAHRIETLQLGVLPEKTISHVLQCVDFGLSPTPYALRTKSGTNAAMGLHGLRIFFSEKMPATARPALNCFFLDQAWPRLHAMRLAGRCVASGADLAETLVHDIGLFGNAAAV